MPSGWSRLEVEAVVADYVDMLCRELTGEPYNKTAHRRSLRPLLARRSEASIERKHQNISAILIGIGYPYIFGYKPLGNYQELLRTVVVDRVNSDRVLQATVAGAVDAPASLAIAGEHGDELLARWEPAPKPTATQPYPPVAEKPSRRQPPINYLERESRNASLGRAGELLALRMERARLLNAGKQHLANRIEHVSELEGDGAGFDIRSFEANGSDRLIEVKTTAYGSQTPFFVSQNELHVSRRQPGVYWIYRIFRFRADPRLFAISGAIDQACRIEPVQYIARVR